MPGNCSLRCDFSAPQRSLATAQGQDRGKLWYCSGGEVSVWLMEMPMPLRPANSRLSPSQSRQLDWYLASTGLGCNPATDRPAREAEFARLSALPDGALRAMGLTRGGLAAHVYRDLFPKGVS
jgi:hypothetical protein